MAVDLMHILIILIQEEIVRKEKNPIGKYKSYLLIRLIERKEVSLLVVGWKINAIPLIADKHHVLKNISLLNLIERLLQFVTRFQLEI